MGFSKFMMASLLLSLVVLELTHAAAAAAAHTDNYRTPTIDCKSACKARCQLSSRPNLCHRACGTCCKRCSCVPPGTAGNYDKCACYASLTTHGGRPKCP
ncbi:Gibberellin-regulated protein 11 [Linum grandiflorum]